LQTDLGRVGWRLVAIFGFSHVDLYPFKFRRKLYEFPGS